MTTSDDTLPPSLIHLTAMSDERGLFEHADHAEPRREGGYCLDDVARALMVMVAVDEASPSAAALREIYLRFTEAAIGPDGRAHNRLSRWGAWTDEPGLGDWWGRAIRGLGAAARARDPAIRARAIVAFERAARRRSPHLRAMSLAAIGAAEVLEIDPGSEPARRLLIDAVAAIPEAPDPGWPWPEPRLRYGNGVIAEALLAAGAALGEPGLTERGLAALSFLVRTETRDGHLSVTGTRGRGCGEDGAQFDQQPIEVVAIAEASARAYHLGLGEQWAETVRMSWAWFLGDNDGGEPMIDPATGAGFDGLRPDGRNRNRGAESTLAAATTLQRLRSLSTAAALRPAAAC